MADRRWSDFRLTRKQLETLLGLPADAELLGVTTETDGYRFRIAHDADIEWVNVVETVIMTIQELADVIEGKGRLDS